MRSGACGVCPKLETTCVDRRSCRLIQGEDSRVKASGILRADENSQAMDDPGDAQVVMIEHGKPPTCISIEPEHPFGCILESSLRAPVGSDFVGAKVRLQSPGNDSWIELGNKIWIKVFI